MFWVLIRNNTQNQKTRHKERRTMPVIQIENLWKEYRLGVIGHGTLVNDLQSWWARVRGREDPNAKVVPMLKGQEKQIEGDRFWALRDINLEVKEGEVLGIIGKNGAGKSTLLKILSRVTAPTRGSIKVKGRIASLLEVGTGFHPELTGRENIYLNGAILGMTKLEVKRKLEEIIEFSGVDQYIDTPVKRYSSGMRVRLAFSVAAHLDPEILVIDEVLAVGDVEFQKKCLGRMSKVSQEGRTILFVSHNLGAINRICSKSIVIKNGEVAFTGSSEDGVAYYLDQAKNDTLGIGDEYDGSAPIVFPENQDSPAQIRQLSLYGKSGHGGNVFQFNEEIALHIDLSVKIMKKDYYVLFSIRDLYDNIIYVSADNDLHDSPLCSEKPGDYHYKVLLPDSLLKPGYYSITVSFTQKNKIGGPIDRHDSVLNFTIVDNDSYRAASGGYRKAAIVAPAVEWHLKQVSSN